MGPFPSSSSFLVGFILQLVQTPETVFEKARVVSEKGKASRAGESTERAREETREETGGKRGNRREANWEE